MGTAFLTGQGAKKVALTGDAVVTDVIVGKTFYKDDPDTQLTGTLALTGDSGVGDVLAGKTFYKDDPTTQLTGTLALIGDAVVAEVLSGKKFYKDDAKTQLTGTMTNKVGSATVITPSTADQAIPQGYYGGIVGDGKVAGDADLVAGNIKSGVTIFGVAGSLSDGSLIAGTDIVASSDNSVLAPMLAADYSVVKSITVSKAGTYKTYFTQSGNIDCAIFVSGVLTGTVRSTAGTYSEDIAVPVNGVIQLCTKNTTMIEVTVSNFRLGINQAAAIGSYTIVNS